METTGSWTDDRVETLKKLWLEGLSASQIAAILGEGVTRNAVIGKVHRLKLSGRAKPASASPRPRAPGRSAPRRVSSGGGSASRPGLGSMLKSRSIGHGAIQGATALKVSEDLDVELEPLPQVQELFIPEDQRLNLLQLSEATCKWPIGDPLSADFFFCGQHSLEGKPYCEFHARRAYHQIEKKKR